ncbi:helix-turn-helix transcriptional regulator [Neogemmobacter tilapiae]|uniref:DNA-binding protein n=1 Tax=Neogemmobacter tilapiae TaxID=875041 RepID=A0A918TU03_9RHOB|nr:helix-turn-helix domain-containing protein [Gemmobacter tilapiae]GHC61924.1 hypothetical protein GCM10007315_27390 [Gemmobacter tilapiae]
MNSNENEKYDRRDTNILLERELAARWKMSARTLQRWRAQGWGPSFIRIGGAIRYTLADVEDYEKQQKECRGSQELISQHLRGDTP